MPSTLHRLGYIILSLRKTNRRAVCRSLYLSEKHKGEQFAEYNIFSENTQESSLQTIIFIRKTHRRAEHNIYQKNTQESSLHIIIFLRKTHRKQFAEHYISQKITQESSCKIFPQKIT